MSKSHFVAVHLYSDQVVKSSGFELALDRAKDWTLISDGAWLLWTSSSSKTWYQRLKPYLQGGENVLIIEVNPSDRAGRLPSRVWEFIKSKSALQ
jgi:hypothetical protein